MPAIEAMARRLCPGAAVCRAQEIPGGLINANFRLDLAGDPNRDRLLLRYWRRGRADADKEIALLRFLKGRVPVPAVLATGAADSEFGLPYALLEWIDAESLHSASAGLAAAGLHELGLAAGGTLAAIHGVRFPQQGFFGADLAPEDGYEASVDGQLAWLNATLGRDQARERVGGALAGALSAFVRRNGEALSQEWARRPTLSHGDFDPTNIMVRPMAGGFAVAAVLDWEFAFAGGPAYDFGHMLRPPLGDQAAFIGGLCAGYRAAGGGLPEDWREAARLADLLSWVDFISQPFCGEKAAVSARQMMARLMAP
ncbi:phosphotransferase family protein [Methylocella silvestris]|uniref:phosphotransferase family protein n=1 Tax=Methylocella silvestris TaxID=199596 RepID=UPI0011AEE152|nr:phosphotransferase [Methylocella silvestris]